MGQFERRKQPWKGNRLISRFYNIFYIAFSGDLPIEWLKLTLPYARPKFPSANRLKSA
jgi:hypothetical protein